MLALDFSNIHPVARIQGLLLLGIELSTALKFTIRLFSTEPCSMTNLAAELALSRQQLGTHDLAASFLGSTQEMIVRALDASGRTEGAVGVHCHLKVDDTYNTLDVTVSIFFSKRENAISLG